MAATTEEYLERSLGSPIQKVTWINSDLAAEDFWGMLMDATESSASCLLRVVLE